MQWAETGSAVLQANYESQRDEYFRNLAMADMFYAMMTFGQNGIYATFEAMNSDGWDPFPTGGATGSSGSGTTDKKNESSDPAGDTNPGTGGKTGVADSTQTIANKPQEDPGVMFYDESGEVLWKTGVENPEKKEGQEKIYVVEDEDKEEFEERKEEIERFEERYDRPADFSALECLADDLGMAEYTATVHTDVNGQPYVYGIREMSFGMHLLAFATIAGEGYVYNRYQIPLNNHHSVTNYWRDYYYTPKKFQKWW